MSSMEENAPRQIRESEQVNTSGEKSEYKQACVPLADSFCLIFLFSVFLAFMVTMFKTVKWWEVLTAKLKTVKIP